MQPSAVRFAYHTPEAVLRLSPSSGLISGSTVVQVHGTGFRPFEGSVCRFGGIEVNATWVSSSEVRCVSRAAESAVGASDELFMGFASEDEVLETAEVHTLGPRGMFVNSLGWLQLTGPAPMQERSIVVRGPRMSGHQYFAASFDLYIGGGTGGGSGGENRTGGEGVSVCLGDLPDAPFGESGAGEGLRVSFLTHAELLEVYYDRELIVRRPTERSIFRAERFVPARVEYGPKGLSVHVDGIALVHEVLLGAWSPLPTWRFGMGARTGEGRTDEHRVDNLLLTVGAQVDPRSAWVEVSSNGQKFGFEPWPSCTTLLMQCPASRQSAGLSPARRQ